VIFPHDFELIVFAHAVDLPDKTCGKNFYLSFFSHNFTTNLSHSFSEWCTPRRWDCRFDNVLTKVTGGQGLLRRKFPEKFPKSKTFLRSFEDVALQSLLFAEWTYSMKLQSGKACWGIVDLWTRQDCVAPVVVCGYWSFYRMWVLLICFTFHW